MAQAAHVVVGTTITKEALKPVAFDKGSYIKNHGNTTSGAIRALEAEGKSRGEIAKLLGIRYQWVRNVLITPIKRPKDVKKDLDFTKAAETK